MRFFAKQIVERRNWGVEVPGRKRGARLSSARSLSRSVQSVTLGNESSNRWNGLQERLDSANHRNSDLGEHLSSSDSTRKYLKHNTLTSSNPKPGSVRILLIPESLTTRSRRSNCNRCLPGHRGRTRLCPRDGRRTMIRITDFEKRRRPPKSNKVKSYSSKARNPV